VCSNDIPLSRVITYNESLTLPYFMACVKEALRHNPAATGLLPRVVGPGGDYHKGVYLPPGTEVALCAWNLHRRNTAVYGEDADIFRPERWTEATPEKSAVMNEEHHLVFGYGRFKCMGENIARIELNKILFELLRRFEWQLCDPMKPMEKSNNYGLFIQKGMWVRVSEKE
jgi:cytochrome P450